MDPVVDECVTVDDMLALVSAHATAEEVALLADHYADEVIASWDEVDPELRRQGLSGAFLAFLSDALLLANSRRV